MNRDAVSIRLELNDYKDAKWKMRECQREKYLIEQYTYERYIADHAVSGIRHNEGIRGSMVSDRTASLGVGREMFERSARANIAAQAKGYRRLKRMVALMNDSFKRLDAEAFELIDRHELRGERIADIAKEKGWSRATGFRRYQAALTRLAEVYFSINIEDAGA